MSRRKIKKHKIKVVINGERRNPKSGLEKELVDALIQQAPALYSKIRAEKT